MTAIAGIMRFDGSSISPVELDAMLNAMAHRGSDGIGQWRGERLGLAHRLLWTTPESKFEHQPLTSGDGRITLIADARIDNRDELFGDLHFDRPHDEVSDSEVIAAAYLEWGQDCARHLLGDFAFAVWDTRTRKLFCARDHFGAKPFYYHLSRGLFVFATEIKALWSVLPIPRRYNDLQFSRFVSGDDSDKAATFFQDISRLPAATTMTISEDGDVQQQLYWTLDRDLEIRYGSDREYAEHFREIFMEAVRCRLRSAYPIGSALSGGMDSSSVACTARHILVAEGRGPLHVYSALYPSIPLSDESSYINAAVAQGGMVAHSFNADEVSPLYDRERLLQQLDDFYTGGNLHVAWVVCELASRENIRVMLHGFDGDTTVSHGLYLIKELALQGKWTEFASTIKTLAELYQAYASYKPMNIIRLFGYPALRRLAEQKKFLTIAQGIEPLHRHFGMSRSKLIKNYLIEPMTPKPALRWWRRLRGNPEPAQAAEESNGIPIVFASLINPEFARRTHLSELRQKSNRDYQTDKQEHYDRLTGGTLSRVLELLDLTSAVFGIESRFPFTDKRLIEYCYAIPASQKLHNGWTRYVLRGAMEGILPPEIQWRGAKSNLGPGLVSTFRDFEGDLIREMVSEGAELVEPYLNMETLREGYQRYVVSREDNDSDVVRLWLAVMLYLWIGKNNQVEAL